MHGWPRRPPGAPARPELEPAPEERARQTRLARWVRRRWHRAQAADDALAVDEKAAGDFGFTELMARSLDTMQAQIARVQLALDPPELVIRIPRDACQFYEFWRARELIAIGRAEADAALDSAGY